MLEISLWPLWRTLKIPLRTLLNEHFDLIGGHLKMLLSKTIDDLAKTLHEEFHGTNTSEHLAKAKIKRRGEQGFNEPPVTVKVFPLYAIESSTQLRVALLQRLGSNIQLDAIRTDAGIDDSRWQDILEIYVTDFIRHALPFALRRMIDKRMSFYRFCHPIDLAPHEPLRVNGKAGHHTVVVIYDGPFSDDEPTIRKAARLWKERSSSAYDYSLGDYDGYTAT